MLGGNLQYERVVIVNGLTKYLVTPTRSSTVLYGEAINISFRAAHALNEIWEYNGVYYLITKVGSSGPPACSSQGFKVPCFEASEITPDSRWLQELIEDNSTND